MNKGAPPPRRSTPRTLLPPPKSPSSQELPSKNHRNHIISESYPKEMQKVLEKSEHQQSYLPDRPRLGTAINDEALKYERSVRHQSELEEELVLKNAHIDKLTNELKSIKQKKQAVDSELAQSLADFMNGQTRWMSEVDRLNEEVRLYKTRDAQAQQVLQLKNKEFQTFQENVANRDAERKRQETKINEPNNTEINVAKLEIHRNNVLITELRGLHTKLNEEIGDLKELNARLTDNNEKLKEEIEHYQYLLIEKTISGDISTHGVLGDESFMEMSELSRNDSESVPPSSVDIQPQTTKDSDMPSAVTSVESSSPKPIRKNVFSPETASPSGDEAERIEGQNTNAYEDSLSSNESQSLALHTSLKRSQFEVASLQNHNRALRVSLERLIARMLENSSFSKAVEESLSTSVVTDFRKRVASYSENPAFATTPHESSQPHGKNIHQSSVLFSEMLFNKNYTGNANRRVFSLGVDQEVNGTKSAPQVSINSAAANESQYDSGSPISVARTRMNTLNLFSKTRSVSPTEGSESGASDAFSSADHDSSKSHGLTKMRKLKLRE